MPPVKLCIGFDFGTSTTKVALRRDGAPATVCAVEPQGGETWFATPSLVRVTDSHLRFGVAARNGQNGVLLENLKVAFLGKATTGPTAYMSPSEIDAYVTAYFCWALSLIRDRIDRIWTRIVKPIEYTPLLHIGAPMSHVDVASNGSLLERYHRVAYAAHQLAFGSKLPFQPHQEPWPLARARIEAALAQPLPPAGERLFHVSPETLAPFVSLLQERQLQPGFHMLVDVGAATTEVALVWFMHPRDEGHQFVPYFDTTRLVGGNDFSSAAIAAGIQQRSSELDLHLRQALFQAVSRDRNSHPNLPTLLPRWKKLQLWETGGGSKNQHVASVFGKQQWRIIALPNFPCALQRNSHLPSNNDLRVSLDPTFGQGRRTHFHMMANAHGLSLLWPHWPNWRHSDLEQFNSDMVTWQRSQLATPLVDWLQQ